MLNWLKSLPLRAALALSAAGIKVTRIEDLFGGLLARGLEISKFASYQQYLEAGSKKVWAAFKACDLVGKVLQDTPYRLVRKQGDGTAVENTDVGALLLNPNPFHTLGEMIYLYAFHMKLTGNAYWAKDEVNFDGNRPRSLWPLNPKRVKIVLHPRDGITGYLYSVNGVEIPYEVDEIMHFRNPHPDNDYYGIGDVEAGADLFNEFVNRETWQSKYWKNGASPSGLLICEDQITDQTKFDEAKKKWQKEYGGVDNSGKTAWLTGKWKYQQLGLTVRDMQNIESTRLNVESIFHLMGVPLSVVGFREAANFATARVDDLIFRRYTVKPLIKILSDTIQSDLVEGWDQRLQIMFDVSGLTDMEAVVTFMVPLFDRGAVSVNELRVAAGLPAKDDPLFDQHFITAGLVPFELAGIAQQEQTEEAARSIVSRFVTGTLDLNKRARLGNGSPPK